MKNIQIPNPCSENWEIMSPQEKGRFCEVCSKCVIDFTQKQPEEIHQIFIENKNTSICGRFYNHQLSDNRKNNIDQIKRSFFKYIPSYFQNNRIILTVLSFILFLTGCSKQKEESCITTTGVVFEDIEMDTLTNKNFEMGEAVLIDNDSVAKIHKKEDDFKRKKSPK
ncbi:hypothetical protein [Chryseobacterium turcicum]|uniref:Uncharacterized protein n=1 Tax=Chryseobacterium turcicum TaxID=2898076 RepID=A0A9Q3V2W5_9FLAO|nr:hypothetical protein [Chryseobacterium turcicum]MCD1116089.1 hypothetical protein [Chryseobacterium turcicum]